MSLTYTVRPISDRSAFTGKHEGSPFTATWADTLLVLEREFNALNGRRLVIEVDVPERGIRNDGQLRADAKSASPAVRIAFESKHGPLVYATDRYVRVWGDRRSRMDDWQHNVRAIALGMEALRKVDRYGITKRGEQYRGFKALPAGTGVEPTGMTSDIAWQILHSETGLSVPQMVKQPYVAFRNARVAAHPDRNGGDRTRWDAVEQAGNVLRANGVQL